MGVSRGEASRRALLPGIAPWLHWVCVLRSLAQLEHPPMPWQARGFPSWVMFLRIYVVCRLIRDYRTQQLTFSDQNARLMAKNMHLLAQNHRVLQCVEGIRKRSRELLEIYADEDGSRKDEVEGMAPAGDRVFSVFYERLKEARDYHRKHPGLELPSVDQEEEAVVKSSSRGGVGHVVARKEEELATS